MSMTWLFISGVIGLYEENAIVCVVERIEWVESVERGKKHRPSPMRKGSQSRWSAARAGGLPPGRHLALDDR
jgi:hypothetical protein